MPAASQAVLFPLLAPRWARGLRVAGGILLWIAMGCDAALPPLAPHAPHAPHGARNAGVVEPDRSGGPGAEGERVRVAYPEGACPTRQIEVEVFRDGVWRPHPRHPKVRAGDVHWEEAEDLLQLRVRCVDPRGGGRPSRWVTGVRVGTGGAASP